MFSLLRRNTLAFLLKPTLPVSDDEPIREELFSQERLEQHARTLANDQVVTTWPERGESIARRVRSNQTILQGALRTIAHAETNKRAITPAAEWMLDNFHVVEEQIADIHKHLPEHFYRELPKLAGGPLQGYPRVYGISWAYVAHTDSRFSAEAFIGFVSTYQHSEPLTMGELWALPITLRVVLVENLARFAKKIINSQRGREIANEYVNKLSSVDRNEALSGLRLPEATVRRAFAVQLVQRLRDHHPHTAPASEPLTRWLGEQKMSIDELVQQEHSSQSAANLSVRNIVTSMRQISAFDWRTFFESISVVEGYLRGHKTYITMDFGSRDRYRHAIEDLARYSGRQEIDVVRELLKRVESPSSTRQNCDPLAMRRLDPGFHLIAEGRIDFEKELGYRPPLPQQLKRLASHYRMGVYLTSIFLLTAGIVAVPIWLSAGAGLFVPQVALLALLGLLPASDVAMTIINRVVTFAFKPRYLPRLRLRSGPTPQLSTFVVVPTLLTSVAVIREQIEQLEVYYLANPNGVVYFALLSDWTDADSEQLPVDAVLLECARVEIAQLNARYLSTGELRFYLFHRKRSWNPSERKWMGWERKRGKLAEFNRLLRGARDTSFLPPLAGEASCPINIRYVITLDADTKLPIDTVSQLVGLAAHPLNQPCFDNGARRVTVGYGLLQPRVTPTLPQREERTVFQRLFTSVGGVDPYGSAASDVYQDLFGEGSFTGKGLYEVDAFERAMAGRVPPNRLLSHDLFEGIFARCALVSDVEVFEEFPSHIEVAAARQHRWARGDWQLLPWIVGSRGRDIPVLGRWKMLDNLRRTLSAPAAILLLVTSWALPMAPHGIWLALVIAGLSFPSLVALWDSVFVILRTDRPSQPLRAFGGTALLAAGQVLFALTLLAHHAWLMADAIVRTLVRLVITHRKLLEWTTAAQAKASAGLALARFLWPLRSATGVVIGASAIVLYFNPGSLKVAAPLLVLWWVAPLFARLLSLPPPIDTARPLTLSNQQALRNIARRTWHFFTTFVVPDDNHLPPDNFQEDPYPTVAHRTSPTNIGLYLLSIIAARDFGWLGLLDMVDRLEATLDSLLKLERHRGHFFNWYDTQTLSPLEPRYVSTVDSGNLAGHLIALKQACTSLALQPIHSSTSFFGMMDTLRLFQDVLSKTQDDGRTLSVTIAELQGHATRLGEFLQAPVEVGHEIFLKWETLRGYVADLRDLTLAFTQERGEVASELMIWAGAMERDVRSHLRDVNTLQPWLRLRLPTFADASGEQHELVKLLSGQGSLADISRGEHALTELNALKTGSDGARNSFDRELPGDFKATLTNALESNAVLCKRLDRLINIAQDLFWQMEFGFLFDVDKRLFSIGYRVGDAALDPSFYDLLASEARFTSLIAIAKRDVPARHWFRLGRRLTFFAHGPTLMSWSGSMFEYLMPSLVLYTPAGSLLDVTCRRVIERQIEYAQGLGMPWGVSESAFYVRDRALTYQYADFGVPGLGLKRGLEQDRVIAPYATALAAMYDAQSALTNFGELEAIGGRGVFGFYEAIDFTRERLPEGRNHAVVQTYMAHHQGMSLIAIANVIYYGIMRHRFHTEPIVRAIELLLQERAPDTAPKFVPIIASERRTPFAHVGPPNARYFTSPHTATPATHLLSNGRYAVMLTAAGSGYSVCGKLAVTRWREDVTRDCWGSYIFIRNTGTGTTWSTGFQPTAQQPDDYAVAFFEERARIIRNDGDITTALEVVVSPEDNAEVRQLRVTNTGARACELELTSYAEVVLAPLAADIAHPAFSNLFIQTEYLTETRALLAMRRRRAENEPQVWAAHVIACALAHSIEYETDRARFIGRGGDVRAPLAVIDGRPLSNTVGAVLDPIFSLRTRVRVEPGATVAITYSTIVSESRDAIVTLADKYSDPTIFERISALAWTFAQIQLHYLKIEPEEAQSLQILANRILFLDPSLRPSPEFLRLNRLGARSLWRLGISGDQPIVLLRISTTEDQDIVWQLLRAHGYWRMKCLAVDLVILNEHSVSYAYDLQRLIETIVGRSQALASHTTRDIAGGIFVVRGDALSGEEQALLLTAARAVVVAGQGSLVEQLSKTWKQATAATTLPPRMRRSTYEPIKLQTPALRYFNGLGGFSADGGEYITLLNKDQNTPAPWINVIANPNFGFMVSESGGSCTFSRNSRSNQLTPWSNDAIVDPAGEIFYLRDEVDGRVWTPCARPIRDNEASYVTHHGKGYSSFRAGVHGILSELHQWVSWSDPVKISRLRLRNSSKVTRRISVTAYLEWVLGATRGESAQYLITHRDDETGALFARNPWNADYGDHVAFADFAGRQTAWTCDRTEFLGRNGGFQNPAALQSGKKLAARDGAGFDACAALQTTVELRPDQEVELVFFLGQTTDQNSARELIRYLRQTPMSQTLQEVKEGWGELLCKVQVRTPDAAMDILLNGWLLYQTISCRYWARAAFYQAGGAYGFRDQLQDSLAIALVAPQLAREHILRASARQFVEGDVQHWWHPPSGRGVRTRVSDDRLWLPYVVAQYIALTGDVAILDTVVSFLDGPPLLPEQDDAYFEPGHSVEHATLYNHCALALDASLKTGVHGLPLMGGGDWNDGMNRVGHEGHGESVWLGWFLIGTIEKFAPLGVLYNDNSRTKRWRDHAVALKNAIETAGWDGSWYRRAYFDNGTPLGSSANTECRIDSLAQSWSVISGVGDPDRARQAVSAVDDYLVRTGDDLVLLFTPPFERTPFDPGYIKGYLPGVRENGGQYTHAAVWVLIANAMLGAGDRVGELFKMLNPIDRTASRAGVFAYKVEPYVIAADIYTEPPHTRRGGWTWYTGAAGWLYQAGIESILGFQVRAGKLTLKPCIPRAWRNYEITFRHHESTYIITVDNPNAVSVGVVQLELDGAPQSGDTILLNDDGKTHRIRAVIGE